MKRQTVRWTRTIVLVAPLLLLLHAAQAAAYERYNDGCQSCHGAFTDATSPKGTVFPSDNKHEMHRSAANMDTDCNLCHTTGDNRNPFTYSSDGTANNVGYGCAGCHGRDYGVAGVRGFGLRSHHAANGVGSCGLCHMTDLAPLPESVSPPYYGTPDTLVDSPCNTAPDLLEDWSIGDGLGLDNDGDNLYDQAEDPDCGTVLLVTEPSADGSLPKTMNNLILCVFDAPVTLPAAGNPLVIKDITNGCVDVSGSFIYSVDADDPTGQTLEARENGDLLPDATWYQVNSAPGWTTVVPFQFEVYTLVGDCTPSARVTTADYSCVKAALGGRGDLRADLNGSARVTTSDYSVVKANLGHRAPAKPTLCP